MFFGGSFEPLLFFFLFFFFAFDRVFLEEHCREEHHEQRKWFLGRQGVCTREA